MAISSLSSLNAAGIGSGLDVNSIVNQLVSIESRPLSQLRTAESKLQTSISTYGKLDSLVSGLRDAARRLSEPGLWTQTTATSSNSDAVAVTSSDRNAGAGSYAVEVSALAQSQSLASSAFESSETVVGGGTLEIEIGAWSSDLGSFNAKISQASISISAGATLANVRDQINAAHAGVTAAIVTDADGARLTLSASESGLNHQIRVRATDPEPGSSLSALSYAPDIGAAALSETRAAANAQASINGLPVNSESNTLDGVLDGMTLQLNATTSSAATITVSANTETPKAAIEQFVKAYNALNSFLTDATAYDPATKKAGALQGDSTAVALRNGMRTLLMGEGGGSDLFSGLGQIGLATAKDGTVSVDETQLQAALGNLPELSRLFSNSGAQDPSKLGFAQRFNQFAGDAIGFEGTISTRTERLGTQVKQNQSAQERMSMRIDQYRARLLAQYTALDTNMGQMSSLADYVSQQVSMLANNMSSGR